MEQGTAEILPAGVEAFCHDHAISPTLLPVREIFPLVRAVKKVTKY
jgi:hypothetical protein